MLSSSSALRRKALHVLTNNARFVPVNKLTNGAIPPDFRIVV